MFPGGRLPLCRMFPAARREFHIIPIYCARSTSTRAWQYGGATPPGVGARALPAEERYRTALHRQLACAGRYRHADGPGTLPVLFGGVHGEGGVRARACGRDLQAALALPAACRAAPWRRGNTRRSTPTTRRRRCLRRARTWELSTLQTLSWCAAWARCRTAPSPPRRPRCRGRCATRTAARPTRCASLRRVWLASWTQAASTALAHPRRTPATSEACRPWRQWGSTLHATSAYPGASLRGG